MSRLRLATFNLENLDDRPDLEPPLAARIALLRPQLLRLDADILCLQEVNGQETRGGGHRGPRTLAALDRLLEGTPYAGYARAASMGPGGEGPADRQNLVVLSRRPIEASRQIRHELVPPVAYRPVTALPPATAPLEASFDRPILYAAVGLPGGRRLHILNLHLKAPLAALVPGQKEAPFVWRTVGGWAEGFFLASVKRSAQALEARLVIERLFDAEPDALVAVAGDFNADAREVPVRTLLGSEEDTGNGALAGRVMVALERSVPEAQRYSVLHAGHAAMLDHLLVSRALLAWHHHAEVHNEGLGDEVLGYAAVHRSPESYHAPVVAEFAIPG
jgi:endonuclease/exonuclease/phosphatase family metal-dependent hydrolase